MRYRIGNHRLTVTELEGRWLPSVYLEVEPNNTALTANVVAVPSGDFATADPSDALVIQGGLSNSSDRDLFRISVSKSSIVFLNIDSRDIGLSTTLNSIIDIYDSTGLVLIASNDQGYDFTSFVPPIAPVSFAASDDPALAVNLSPGDYVVRVSSFISASSGNYELRIFADETFSPMPPIYASRPGAAHTLFLDFDGHQAVDDWGNYSAAPFDLDGQPTSYSASERWAIYRQWQIVAEDFVALDINVTTVDPGVVNNGQAYRMVVTNSAPSIINQPVGVRGAAWPGSYTGAKVNTGFVFASSFGDYLGGMSGRMIAGALDRGNESSRQFGAAAGLRNYGAGNSQPIGIMQTPSPGLRRATWSVGWTHSGEAPIVFQDDISALTNIGGIPLRADDVGDTFATAADFVGNDISGVITNLTTDRDMFRIPSEQGFHLVRLEVDPWAGNLDTEIRIYNSIGQLLVQGDHVSSFGNIVSYYVAAAGDCFVEIRSDGDPGEVGSYHLHHSLTPVVDPVHVNSMLINDGHSQRSNVKQIEVRFSRPIQFPSGTSAAIQLIGPSGPVNADIDLSAWTPSETPILIRFPNGAGGFGSLPNGVYQFRLVSDNIIDDAGNRLDGDTDGQAGVDFVVSFHRLSGDFNGDRLINAADFLLFRTVYGQTGSTGLILGADINDDGFVSATDFVLFRNSYGMMI